MIVYVSDPENCEVKIGDILQYEDIYRPPIKVTGIRKLEPEKPREEPRCTCPHCGGDLDDYMEA